MIQLFGDPWKLSLTGQWHFLDGSSKTVIDRSMTLSKGPWSNFLETPENCHWLVNHTSVNVPISTSASRFKIFISQSMAILMYWKMKGYTLWFFIDWPLNQWEVSILCSWPMRSPEMRMSPGFNRKVYFWKLSLTSQWHSLKVHDPAYWRPLKTVIDRSMTLSKGPWSNFWETPENVIDRSMTLFRRLF